MNANPSRYAWPSINIRSIALMFAMVSMSVFVGLIASTTNLILVVLLIGLLLGIPLLASPRIAVWIILPIGMMSGSLMAILGTTKIAWAISLLSMMLMLLAIIRLIVGVKNIPTFFWLALAFMLFTISASVVQGVSLNELASGFKRYFQMFGLMFALILLDFKAEDRQRWLTLMLVMALLQLPFCLYQYFILVPIYRGVYLSSGSYDVVAGTMGGSLESISNNGADMAAFLIMTLAFLLARYRAKLVSFRMTIVLSVILLAPLALSENKIVVFLLPLTWFVIMRKEFAKKPVWFFLQFFGVLLIVFTLGAVYIGMNVGHGGINTPEKVLDDVISYNVGSKGHGESTRLNRTTVFSFWWENQGWQDPISALIGNGLGSSMSNLQSPVQGRLGIKYFGWGIDLTSASVLLWETGFLGLLLFLSILVSAWISAGRLWSSVAEPSVRADALAIQTCIIIFAIFLPYESSLTDVLTFQLIMAFVLGYLSCLMRTHLSRQVAMRGSAISVHQI